jgi:hypothetical protein
MTFLHLCRLLRRLIVLVGLPFPRLAKPRQGLGFYRLLRRLVEGEALIREFSWLLKNLQQLILRTEETSREMTDSEEGQST